MQWVRLDTAFPMNPKILALADDKQWRASFVYICSLAYSGQHETDGYIPRLALPLLHGTKREADKLVEVGLWIPSGQGGWDINGWREFQPSSDDMEARRLRAKAAADIRWAKIAGDA